MAEREILNTNEIQLYLHCGLCLEEKPADVTPHDWSQTEAGWTVQGLQVWCKRHECNVVHIDFEGATHPANITRQATGPKLVDGDTPSSDNQVGKPSAPDDVPMLTAADVPDPTGNDVVEPTFKVWMEIERWGSTEDPDHDEYEKCGEPVPLGLFDSYREAADLVTKLSMDGKGPGEWE